MSMVTVHGPNTMYTTQGGGQSIPSNNGGVAQATKDPTNGLKFSFSVPNPGANPATCFDWTFTGPGSPVAQADRFSGTVTFTGPGAVTIICTVTGATPPPTNQAYTVSTTATAGTPRMVEDGGDGGAAPQSLMVGEESGPSTPEVPVGFDPAAHSVPEVMEYVNDHPDQAGEIYDAEVAGKNRTTLLSQLEPLIPYDPGDWSVSEVVTYAEENPDEVADIIASEEGGKNRSTLLTQLRAMT